MAQQTQPQTPPARQQQPPPDPMKIVEGMLTERLQDITAALPPLLKPQAKDFIRLALVDLPRQKGLLDVAAVAPQRILIALMDIARMGLFPGSKLGEAYVVPFKRNERQRDGSWRQVPDCQAIIGYRGFLKLARRSGDIADIRARVVSREDVFDIEFGTTERIIHKPALAADRGDPENMIGIYVVADFKGGGHHVEWMSAAEIWEVAKRSATYSEKEGKHLSGPWVTDFVEMCKKTVARRASKWLPLTVDSAEAIGRDEEREIVVEAESRPAGEVLAIGQGGGFKVFDAGRYSDPESEPEPVPQAQPQQGAPPAQQQAPAQTAPQRQARAPKPAGPSAQGPAQTAPPAPAQQQAGGTPPPISPAEAEAILRREAAERQRQIEADQAQRTEGWATGD